MGVVEYRYICGNCGMWHHMAFCPHPRAAAPRPPIEQYRAAWLRERELKKAGVISTEPWISGRLVAWGVVAALAFVAFLIIF